MQARIAAQSALHPPFVFPHDGHVLLAVEFSNTAIEFFFDGAPATALRSAAAQEAYDRRPG